MHGTHHPALVAVSILIAIIASYAALDLAGRVAAARDRTRFVWLGGGSIAMGVGIWSMHFTAMLAYRLPVPIGYDPGLTLLSLVIAIGASLVALVVAARATAGIRLVLAAGFLMAAAISGMHYVGMAGVRVSGRVDYLRGWVVASLAIALVASVAALWLARYFRHGQSFRALAGKMVSAVVMGFAITGMHYTAMEAVLFTPAAHGTDSSAHHLLAPAGLTLLVVVGTLIVLALTLLAGFADRSLRARMDSAHPDQRREQFLRTLAMVEVGIVIIAVLAMGGLGYAVIDQTADAEHHQMLLHLNERGQTHVTLSHLWLEEALHGDDSFDVEEEVFGNLLASLRLCGTSLHGGRSAFGEVLPSGTPHPRGRIATLCGQIDDLLSLTRERLADPEASFAGGLSDQRYDALFREILANSEAIDRHHRQMLAQTRRLTGVTLAAMLMVLVVFAALLLTVTTRARRMLRRDHQELQRLASIVGSSHDSIALTSPEGTILNWNPGAERIFGYSAAEAVGRSISMLVPEEERERENAIRDAVLRGQWVSSYETVRLRRDGGRVDLSLSLAPVQDAYGGVIAISSIARDITERKQAEKALQRKEEYFRALIENGSDLVYILDSEARIRYIAPSVQPLLGYTPEEVIGRSSFEFVHPDDQDHARRAITDDSTTGKDGGTLVLRLRDREGGWRTFEARGSNLLSDPNIRGIVVNAHDVTERVNADQKLQARERQLADAQRIAGLGSWDYDLVTGKVRWSDQMYRNFGLDPAVCEVTYEQYMERIHPDDREQVGRGEELSAQHQVKPTEEYRVVWPDGTERVLQELGGADYGPDGKPIRLFGTAQDITERKRVEEALVRAKEEAEAADRAKSEFLSSMSHELRTPLNSVIGFSKVLAKNKAGNLLEQDLSYLERIRSNGMHLLGLINDVLDLSRIEAGKMELDLAPLQVETVLADVVEQLSGVVCAPGLELRLRVPEGVAPLETDAGKLKQVLINLVGNAIKFTEQGSVTVSLEADARTRLPVRIDVRDTGIGIPPERLPAIFQAFEQAESGTARRFGGTGLGLAISSSLIDLMGFRLEVESIPGEGSTFSILLTDGSGGMRTPEADGFKPSVTGAQGDVTRIDPPTCGSRGELVLVIDDSADARRLLTHHLGELGYRTITASTGEQGLRMAREFGPDLITLDLLLPGISGWEVLRKLKAAPGLCDVPVVIVSAAAGENRGKVLGAVDLLEKPFDQDELRGVLNRSRRQESTVRLLVVDDDKDARDLIRAYLRDEGVEIRDAESGQAALAALETFSPDLIIVDLLMPNLDGAGLLHALHESDGHRGIPVVVVTAMELSNEERASLSRRALVVLSKDNDLEAALSAVIQQICERRQQVRPASFPLPNPGSGIAAYSPHRHPKHT